MRTTPLLILLIPVFLFSQPIEGDKSIGIQGAGIVWPDSIRNIDVRMTNGYFYRDNIEVFLGGKYSYFSGVSTYFIIPGFNYNFLLSDNILLQTGISIPYDISNSILYTSIDIHIVFLLSEMAGLKITNALEFESETWNKTDKVFIGGVFYY